MMAGSASIELWPVRMHHYHGCIFSDSLHNRLLVLERQLILQRVVYMAWGVLRLPKHDGNLGVAFAVHSNVTIVPRGGLFICFSFHAMLSSTRYTVVECPQTSSRNTNLPRLLLLLWFDSVSA